MEEAFKPRQIRLQREDVFFGGDESVRRNLREPLEPFIQHVAEGTLTKRPAKSIGTAM
jgi:hypothetical protein